MPPPPIDVPGTHVSSHTHLLSRLESVSVPRRPPGSEVLAVVPTSRPDPHRRSGIRTAIDLAGSGAVKALLVICSKNAAAGSSIQELTDHLSRSLPATVPAIVVRLGRQAGVLPRFGVDRLEVSRLWRTDQRGRMVNDVGIKRNLALAVALKSSWRHVLFLDDDVRPVPAQSRSEGRRTLHAGSVAAALRAMEEDKFAAVGWTLRNFDDNSVICRARSLAGHFQDQFIGGGALAVKVHDRLPFFPAIYNEDWLFLLGMLTGDRSPSTVLASAGDVIQDPYPGYLPARARSEELGDILGEGLLPLLEAQPDLADQPPPASYWREVIAARAAMIDDLRCKLSAGTDPAGTPQREHALEALRAAREVHETLATDPAGWADRLAGYLPRWTADLHAWWQWLDTLPQLSTDALLPAELTRVVHADHSELLVGTADRSPLDGAPAVPHWLRGWWSASRHERGRRRGARGRTRRAATPDRHSGRSRAA